MMKNNRGVALATLVIAVIVMLTIAGTITYTSLDSIKLRRLDDMYNDIRLLKQKVTSYHIENNELPILENVIKYEDIENVVTKKQEELVVKINENDAEEGYRIIDLEKLDGITLKYGKDYEKYKDNSENIENDRDVYIINKVTHTIYYLKGITIDDVTKYALEETYSKIDLPEIDEEPSVVELFTYAYNSDNTAVLTGVKEGVVLSGECIIPSETVNEGETYTVTSIGYRAFYGSTGLTSITIPEGVISIGESAFYGCTSLTSITIPEVVTSIGESAFYRCTSLTSITIPEGVTSIGEGAFISCSSLTEITIPNGVTSIGRSIFEYCTNLTEITIPDSVTIIGKSAFKGCAALTSINIPEGVTTIEEYAFRSCSGLISIEIPEGITTIERNIFDYCTSLKAVIIPSSVTSIVFSAFNGCNSLERLEILSKEAVISASNEQWDSYENLIIYGYKDSRVQNTVTHYNESYDSDITFTAFAELVYEYDTINKTATVIKDESYRDLPSNLTIAAYVSYNGESYAVKSIEDETFANCVYLRKITIGEKIESIGNYAFSCCERLQSVEIRDHSYNSMIIGEGAFSACGSLENIKIPSRVSSIDKSAFEGCSDDLTIYGYAGSTAETYALENNIKFSIITE